MSLLVVGSVALDSIETPNGKVEDALGGSATYICLAASYLAHSVHLVGVVGDDFSSEHIDMLKEHKIELDGLQIIKGGKTFRWGGKYHTNMNIRDTIYTELNVFENFEPVIPENLRSCEFIVLGNIDPPLQTNVLNQISNPEFIVCDTMNLWIDIRKEELLDVIKRVNLLIINDTEATMLTDETNLFKAAKIIGEIGPEYLVIKKGEHGALLFGEDKIFSAPAFPLTEIVDPTGAGDTFAGGLTGYLHQEKKISFESIKRAVIYGSVMASFCVQHFSTSGLENLNEEIIKKRYNDFKNLSEF